MMSSGKRQLLLILFTFLAVLVICSVIITSNSAGGKSLYLNLEINDSIGGECLKITLVNRGFCPKWLNVRTSSFDGNIVFSGKRSGQQLSAMSKGYMAEILSSDVNCPPYFLSAGKSISWTIPLHNLALIENVPVSLEQDITAKACLPKLVSFPIWGDAIEGQDAICSGKVAVSPRLMSIVQQK